MSSTRELRIADRPVGAGHPAYIIAEMSANHAFDYDRACEIVRAAKEAGADAIKLQTYTPDTMTLDCDNPHFRLDCGTIWDGRTLHQLYETAYTPWDWQPKLKALADAIGLTLFSTPFDVTAVDFLEAMDVPAHKIASFELVDLPLLEKVAATRKPVILSTGLGSLGEIEEAVRTLRRGGCPSLALLHCVSAYPASFETMHLRTIPHLADAFDAVTGLSDHTLDLAVPVAAVSLGAHVIEKHFTLSRSVPGPDSSFSLEPAEFRQMVETVRRAEAALGTVRYGADATEEASRIFRRSLFVVRPMRSGETFSPDNVRSIRPGSGLHTRHLTEVMGRRASRDIPRGTPLSWDLIAGT